MLVAGLDGGAEGGPDGGPIDDIIDAVLGSMGASVVVGPLTAGDGLREGY